MLLFVALHTKYSHVKSNNGRASKSLKEWTNIKTSFPRKTPIHLLSPSPDGRLEYNKSKRVSTAPNSQSYNGLWDPRFQCQSSSQILQRHFNYDIKNVLGISNWDWEVFGMGVKHGSTWVSCPQEFKLPILKKN